MTKQEKLIAAVRAAQTAGGYQQKDLARMAGTSQGNLSAALSGKYGMSEEKWRLLCESLMLDYDVIVADDPPAPARPITEGEKQMVHPVDMLAEKTAAVTKEALVVSDYIASKLEDDLRGGTQMQLEDIRVLLEWVFALRKKTRTEWESK